MDTSKLIYSADDDRSPYGGGIRHSYDSWNFLRNGYMLNFAGGGHAIVSAGYVCEPDTEEKVAYLGINIFDAVGLSSDSSDLLDTMSNTLYKDIRFNLDEEGEPDLDDKKIDKEVEKIDKDLRKMIKKNSKYLLGSLEY